MSNPEPSPVEPFLREAAVNALLAARGNTEQAAKEKVATLVGEPALADRLVVEDYDPRTQRVIISDREVALAVERDGSIYVVVDDDGWTVRSDKVKDLVTLGRELEKLRTSL